jgi:diguanylate cyclase (GGDEF)-like protein
MSAAFATKLLVCCSAGKINPALGKALREHYEVREAEGVMPSWQAVMLDNQIHVVILDLRDQAPDLSELVRQIRSSRVERIQRIPILALIPPEQASAHLARFGEIFPFTLAHDPDDDAVGELLLRLQVLNELSVTRDALERSRQETQAVRSMDPDTDLLLLPSFDRQLEKLLSHARRSLMDASVISLRLTIRHTGNDDRPVDDLMTSLGRSVASTIRLEDLACRSDHAEFCVATPNCGTTDILRFAARLRKIIESHVALGETIEVWAYAGVASLAEDMQRDANGLRYHAQRRARQAQETGSRHIIMGGKSGPVTAPLSTTDATTMDLGLAMALIQAGRQDEVVAHLPSLLVQLGPLFRLIREQQDQARNASTRD